ncbi:hypothetical protein C7974DRAFT_76850 [Boeremia exigua]|uniref:uncharacterized protein n=1 Tax=Boeremia exigua TaxID=749465 RepID=UPI001E8EA05C|nr:uncharacterized protein C7974DRAFT_76850 [Boeremia exigua]KAH6613193.1 hypothetical protein C7974DRAFT_76850 [Boeremia exigua]
MQTSTLHMRGKAATGLCSGQILTVWTAHSQHTCSHRCCVYMSGSPSDDMSFCNSRPKASARMSQLANMGSSNSPHQQHFNTVLHKPALQMGSHLLSCRQIPKHPRPKSASDVRGTIRGTMRPSHWRLHTRTMENARNIVAPEERILSKWHHIRQLSDHRTRIAVLPRTTYPQHRLYKVPHVPHSEGTLAQLHYLQSARRVFKVS